MEPETVINLFDSSWFYLNIFENQSKTSNFEPNPGRKIQENSSKPKVSEQLRIRTRSKSDQLITNTDIYSPNSVLFKPHLQTILSQREITSEIPQIKKPSEAIILSKKKNRLSKSLSELEFEEVKGFMDLGFVFSEEDKDSNLVEIIPGLQKMGKKEQKSIKELCGQIRARPYLSEAWEDSKRQYQLMKWRVPQVSNEIDMKDSLKWWAHTVASAVR